MARTRWYRRYGRRSGQGGLWRTVGEQEWATWHEGDLHGGFGGGVPVGHRLDVLRGDADPVLVAQQVFQQDLHGERQAGDIEAPAQCRQAEIREGRAVDVEGRAC